MRNAWQGRRVFVTGHTGFKGSWLALWLQHMGAEVTGFSLPPPTHPSLFDLAQLADRINHVTGDIRDFDALSRAVRQAAPELVFHLAAQPLVRHSYAAPVETYAANVMGTVHLLEAVRQAGGITGVVCITTDKCYENREWAWPYRETDPLGGYDPYSSSKACAEIVSAAYRQSFFPVDEIANGGCAIATVRAGNVIGGGDFAEDRLIPDLVRAFEAGTAPAIRSPNAVRPWQHVLEALRGYLMIAERMLAGDSSMAQAWNFGPSDDDARPVSWIVEHMRAAWGGAAAAPVAWRGATPHEAGLLRLDASRARAHLGWRPALPLGEAIEWIAEWHRTVGSGARAREVTIDQIERYAARLSADTVPA